MTRRSLVVVCMALTMMGCAAAALAETCTTASDMDAATRTALVSSGQRYFDFIAKGDMSSLRQAAIPSLAADFSAIEATVKDNQAALAGYKSNGSCTVFIGSHGHGAHTARGILLRSFWQERPDG